MSRPRLVVALDVDGADTALGIASRLEGRVDVLKVGLELFTTAGPDLVRRLVDRDWKVFLDLKVHDIPATAAGAVRAAGRLGVELLTLHASGGHRMLTAAAEARGEGRRPRLLAVTVLTSLGRDDLERVGWRRDPGALVERLQRVARGAGCDGVVASVHEARAIKDACGSGFLVVTPGIRPTGAATDDQARVATPAAAVRAGSDYLVVGRPILRAADPGAAADAIREEMVSAT